MRRSTHGRRWPAAAGALAWALLGYAAPAPVAEPAAAECEAGRQLMLAACVQCHSLRPVQRTRNGAGGWLDTVERMVVFGAQLDADRQTTG